MASEPTARERVAAHLQQASMTLNNLNGVVIKPEAAANAALASAVVALTDAIMANKYGERWSESLVKLATPADMPGEKGN